MTLITLRKMLADDLRTVCEDFRLKAPSSDEDDDWQEKGITIFEQDVPPPRMDSDHSYHPFIIVRLSGGNIVDTDEQNANIVLIISTWDDKNPVAGIDDVINIIERIKNNYLAHPILGKMFYCKKEMSYEIGEEQADPYWYGSLTMTWEIPKTNLSGDDYV